MVRMRTITLGNLGHVPRPQNAQAQRRPAYDEQAQQPLCKKQHTNPYLHCAKPAPHGGRGRRRHRRVAARADTRGHRRIRSSVYSFRLLGMRHGTVPFVRWRCIRLQI